MKRRVTLIGAMVFLILTLMTGVVLADKILHKKHKFKTKADIVYRNATVLTVNSYNDIAEAVAVKDGKILAVGSNREIRKFIGRNTVVKDLNNKPLLPGFYDAHGHFGYSGLSYYTQVQLQSPPIGTIKNMEELIAALAERAATTEPDGWVHGWGYDDVELAEKIHPTRWDLDQVSTELPVVITHFSGHNIVANSKAIELAGITVDTPDPVGGQIGKTDGQLNGQFWETAASLVTQLLPPASRQDQLEGIALASEVWASKGATTANEGAWADFELFKKAADEGYLKVRANLWFTLEGAIAAHDEMGHDRSTVKYYGDEELVALNGIKLFQDGSPQLRTAFMTDPYYTTGEYPEDWVAYPRQPREKLIELVVAAHEAGFNQIYIHGNGDAAIDDVIAAYVEVRKPGYRQPAQPDDLRHTIIHCQFNREDQFDTMAEYWGIIPSFLIMHPYFLGDRHWEIFFGPERSARMSATQDAVDRNLPFTLHSDTPVFPHDPLLMMHTAVNRQSYTGRDIFTTAYETDSKYRSVDQRITPEQALRALTINGAYENGEENITGSIEIGKRADLVILEENPLTVDSLHIKDIKVLETIVGGKTVFEAQGSEGDLNRDGIIDRKDVNIINRYRNQPASANPDCDIDGDGTITILDARKLVNMCTYPNCAAH